jgi:hypothetical protein
MRPRHRRGSASDKADFFISVALSFEGGPFDPEELTARIGVHPTHSGRAGETLKFGGPRRRDLWAIRVGPRDALDLEELLVELFEQLRPGWEQIKQVAQELRLELVIGFVVEIRTNTGPIAHFTPPVLAQLIDLGAALDIDLLVRRPRPDADAG